jgi:hypothetical protein
MGSSYVYLACKSQRILLLRQSARRAALWPIIHLWGISERIVSGCLLAFNQGRDTAACKVKEIIEP